MSLRAFPPQAFEKLKYYVYLYSDPRTDKPFYVGKGRGNRAFCHLDDDRECEKVAMIAELKALNLSPVIEILKYGLLEEEALLVEATAIDLLSIDTLTNEVRGHGVSVGSRATVEDVAAILSEKPAKIDDPLILVRIARAFRGGMTPQALYDATRSAWKVGARRRSQARYACAVYQQVIREVYEIAAWAPGGSTMRSTDVNGRHESIPDRWEFVGKVAEPEIRRKYVGRVVNEFFPDGAMNPIRYVNCDGDDD
jgi:hypothetical protein